MYKIFFNDRFLSICNDPKLCSGRDNAIIYKVIKKSEIKPIVEEFRQSQAMMELWLCVEDEESAMEELSSMFNMVESAGGLVLNGKREYLLIYRHERWDLPKGKRETGETIPETAIREVEEECGVDKLTVHDFLACSYHVYTENDVVFLKKTYWYRMSCPGACTPKPQLEEGIVQACWVPNNELPQYLPKMFSSIADMLQPIIL